LDSDMINKYQIVHALSQFAAPDATSISPEHLRYVLTKDYGGGSALTESQAGQAVARLMERFCMTGDGEIMLEHVGGSWATAAAGRKQKVSTPYDDWQNQSSFRLPPPPPPKTTKAKAPSLEAKTKATHSAAVEGAAAPKPVRTEVEPSRAAGHGGAPSMDLKMRTWRVARA